MTVKILYYFISYAAAAFLLGLNFCYVVKRFRRNARKCGTLDELRPHL